MSRQAFGAVVAAVLLVSDDPRALRVLADRVRVMSAGRIVCEASGAEADHPSIGLHGAGHA
jgi:ABC-type uncharacterized transport system ATPase subunit